MTISEKPVDYSDKLVFYPGGTSLSVVLDTNQGWVQGTVSEVLYDREPSIHFGYPVIFRSLTDFTKVWLVAAWRAVPRDHIRNSTDSNVPHIRQNYWWGTKEKYKELVMSLQGTKPREIKVGDRVTLLPHWKEKTAFMDLGRKITKTGLDSSKLVFIVASGDDNNVLLKCVYNVRGLVERSLITHAPDELPF